VPQPATEPEAASPVIPPRQDQNPSLQGDADDVAPHPSTDAIAPPSKPRSSGAGEEESIESYMERLMQRVRGDEPAGKVAGTPPSAPVAASASPTGTEQASPSVGSGGNSPAAELPPRRPAPEQIANMSAMRDLANTAARSAIDHHVRKHTGQQATGRLLGALLTVGLSAALGCWGWQTNSIMAAAGALIGGGLGAHWLLSAVRRLSKLRRLNAAQDPQGNQVG